MAARFSSDRSKRRRAASPAEAIDDAQLDRSKAASSWNADESPHDAVLDALDLSDDEPLPEHGDFWTDGIELEDD